MTVRAAPPTWLSAQEIADAALPGFPRSKQKVNERAQAERWALETDGVGRSLARRRAGRGGGTEYHVALLPEAARLALERRADPSLSEIAPAIEPGSRWEWYERQTRAVKAEAERRFKIVAEVEAMIAAGLTKSAAIGAVAANWSISMPTIWNWLRAITSVSAAHRLPHLAPERKGGGKRSEIDADLWQALLSDYLRLSQPSWESCVRRAAEVAAIDGRALPSAKALWRKFEREVPPQVATLRRKGPDALRRLLPPQKRTVADLHAMELVNIDGHTCDVFVQWPGEDKPRRPVLVAIQDVYSRKFLAWRIADKGEDTLTARLCFADLFAKYGIPYGLLSDNGRAFASKWLTGGTPNRFRFKVRDEEPVGILTALNVEVHWALPFRGQSKPIERGFRDFCDAIAKHPAFEGSYTGNSATNKPDNYDPTRGVPLETFKRIWDAGMHAHNARKGRRTEMALAGDSFDDVFERSYKEAPIRKATAEQLRIALYAADHVRGNSNSGAVKVLGNSYWCDELIAVAGQMLTVRFDPEDATQPVHVYDGAGRFIASAPMWEASGFLSASEKKLRAKLEANFNKATKLAEKALRLLTADRLAAMLPDYEDEAPTTEPSVIRPVSSGGATVGAVKAAEKATERASAPQFIDTLVDGFSRFRRASGE